ncbi:hypothetical protein [Staphylothermus marinus]|uniref:hypothetical protein n=1 Tax=Staphylothermus marinus TaxID=2280 RepID=UPI0011E57995|nr:hypothetical protein [Staphylothermus marinus]
MNKKPLSKKNNNLDTLFDDFIEKSDYWHYRIDNFARIVVENSGCPCYARASPSWVGASSLHGGGYRGST